MIAALTPARRQGASPHQETEVWARQRRATGQLADVTSMYEDGRYCVDVLDPLSTGRAAPPTAGTVRDLDCDHASGRDGSGLRGATGEQVTIGCLGKPHQVDGRTDPVDPGCTAQVATLPS